MERRKFTREFKLEAVKLVKDRGVSYARYLAPKFYPVLSSPLPDDLPCWAVGATGAGAEPSA
jgi:hypothetical protein